MSKPYRPSRIASIALFMAGRAHRLGLVDEPAVALIGTDGQASVVRSARRASTRQWLCSTAVGRREPVEFPEPRPRTA